MWNKIKGFLLYNWGLKLISLAFSMLLWFVVVNVDDPSQTRSFTVPVSITNEAALKAEGKYFSLYNNTNTVTLRATAKRSIIEKMTASDFTATADMTKLQDETRVPVDIVVNRYQNSVNVAAKQLYLFVDIEEQQSVKMTVEPKLSGEPASGCVVTGVKVKPNIITITGRLNDVTTIGTVGVLYDIASIDRDISESDVQLVLYDVNGNQLSADKFELSNESVAVEISTTHVKRVPLVYGTTGQIDSELELSSITCADTTVMVCGKPSELEKITEIKLPDTVVNLSNIYSTTTISVDLSQYLPTGISLYNRNNNLTSIVVDVNGNSEKTIEFDTANVQVVGADENVSVNVLKENLHLIVSGRESILNNFEARNIRATVDVSDVKTGTHLVPVRFEGESGVTVTEANVIVTITKDAEVVDNNKPQNENVELPVQITPANNAIN